MVCTLDSRDGSITQVSRAACPAVLLPALSRPARRPPLPRLAASRLSSRPGQGPVSGLSISGQIQAMSSRGWTEPLAVGQNGSSVRPVPSVWKLVAACAASG